MFSAIVVPPEFYFVFETSSTLAIMSRQLVGSQCIEPSMTVERCISLASFCKFEVARRFWRLRNSVIGVPSAERVQNAEVGHYP